MRTVSYNVPPFPPRPYTYIIFQVAGTGCSTTYRAPRLSSDTDRAALNVYKQLDKKI
ncbi:MULTISPECIES: hypothetical protein [unclassified Dehalobacter]|uniref:hypothetical protein n=1 Tax=unclassified Dehalobacter TaxID=2635733 RepID=UPI001313DA33|nr:MULTISPECIES: hypothetical protein [unclassified Dehalobacter]